jgi:cation diffusion facilitator CzcD-associated flavoprotein CzcO
MRRKLKVICIGGGASGINMAYVFATSSRPLASYNSNT